MLLKYLSALLNKAANGSVTLTDRLTILIVPFTTLVLWLAGAPVTNSVQETIWVGVAITVLAVVLLRLIAASYFVWKDDQREKRNLRRELNDPERQVSASLREYTTERRKLLSERLARLSALANYKTEYFVKIGITISEINELCVEIDALINQLSYDPPLRVASIRLKDYCIDLITGKSNDRDRLWAQRKLTFQLLHRADRVSDIVTLVDIEILTGEDFNQGEAAQKLKDSILQLGEKYYDPEVATAMRKALNDDD